MKNYVVEVVSAGNAILAEYPVPEIKDDEILIRNDYSVVSAGTERAWSQDSNNAHPTFPYYPGYSAAGTVVKVGASVSGVSEGDRVINNWTGHRLYAVKKVVSDSPFTICGQTGHAQRSNIVFIPDNVDTLDAAFTHIASFPINGVRKLHLEWGESAMVAGQGILGVFAMQVAGLSGALPLIVSDLSKERRDLALKLGADFALDPASKDYIKQVRDITHGAGVNAIVEVTGSAVALQQALEYAAFEARISLLGCTRVSDAPIDFYRYVHCRGVQLLGAHTIARATAESSFGRWTQEDDYRAFLKFLSAGKIKTQELISEVVSPEKAHDVFQLIARKDAPIGIVFDWRNFA